MIAAVGHADEGHGDAGSELEVKVPHCSGVASAFGVEGADQLALDLVQVGGGRGLRVGLRRTGGRLS